MHRKSLFVLLGSVAFLIVVGIVMLLSTCLFSVHADAADGYREAKRQGVWLVIGLLACWGAATIDYRFWRRHHLPIFLGVCFLLALCFVPYVGFEINGERRWIGIGPLRLQPSELGKILVVVSLAAWFAKHPDSGASFLKGFIAPLALVALPVGLILFEVDIGTTAVLAIAAFVVLFVAGTQLRYLGGLALSGVAAFIGMMSYAPDRMERVLAFLDLETHRHGAGFQQWISLMAIGSGGVAGRGMGEGRLKMLYMPFAHTDFIFPMIAEEMGLVVTILVVLAFISLVVAGFVIGFHAPDRFGTLLAVGFSSVIGVQAFLNIGVATAMLPNTGLTLPFVSYGGSSLVGALIAVGILVNVYRQGLSDDDARRDWVLRTRCTPRL